METTVTKAQQLSKAKEFVRKVLADSFNQKVDDETLREVAEKVTDAVHSQTGSVTKTKKRAA